MNPTTTDMPRGIENPTRTQIENYLAKIKWSLRNHGCEHYYFYNHKGVCTKMYLLFPETDARICLDGTRKTYHHRYPSFVFYLKQVVMEHLSSGNAISFKGKTDSSIFILCANHDMTSPHTASMRQ